MSENLINELFQKKENCWSWTNSKIKSIPFSLRQKVQHVTQNSGSFYQKFSGHSFLLGEPDIFIPIVRQSRPLIYSYNTECSLEAYGSMHSLVEVNKDKSLF